jgi:GDPmannose 4,6-dehydratase
VDLHNVMTTIASVEPDEIYNLAGQSSVGLSFEQPSETIQSIVSGTQNLLEAIRLTNKSIKLYSAGSSECFGDSMATPAKEDTRFSPKSPYALAKSAAFWQVAIYRESYGLRAATGILFNHESVLRGSRFVTSKILSTAKRIAKGADTKLVLGDLDIHRDWGYSPEYVKAMWLMLQMENPTDIVVSTGHTMSLRDFVSYAFEYYGLDWTRHTSQDPSLFRPNELRYSCGNPEKANQLLGWKARTFGRNLVFKLAADLDEING